MYIFIICFYIVFFIFIYKIYNKTKIYNQDNYFEIINCLDNNNNPLCNTTNVYTLHNNKYNNMNKNKYNINNSNNTTNTKNNDTIEYKLSQQLLDNSSYKCKKINSFNDIRYFENINTDQYTEWNDIEYYCKKMNGFLFY